MEERDSGIIIRVRPLTETSLIVQWLGHDHGLISTVAKGARKPKSTFAGKLDLYYFADFTFQRSSRSELHPLREMQLISTNEKLRRDLMWLNQAAYASALIEQTAERETPVPEQYELLKDFLERLPDSPAAASMVITFEADLLEMLGFGLEGTDTMNAKQAFKGRHLDCVDLSARTCALRIKALGTESSNQRS